MKDVLNTLKERKKKFSQSLNSFTQFLRDWSGVEHDYSKKLSSLLDQSSNLTRVEKISTNFLREAVQMIKNFISGSSLIHSRFSKTIEILSTSEIIRIKCELIDSYKILVESCKLAGQEYRKDLTDYAAVLVDSSEVVVTNTIDLSKTNIKEVQVKHRSILKDILSSLSASLHQTEDAIRSKVFELIDHFDRTPKIIDEKVLENIFDSQSTGEQVLTTWVSPRFKLIFHKIDSSLAENLCVPEDFVSLLEGKIKEIISSLSSKCRNSTEVWTPQVCQFMIGVCDKIIETSHLRVQRFNNLPEVQDFLNGNEEKCIQMFDEYFSAVEVQDKVWVSRVVNRVLLLEQLDSALFRVFDMLDDSEFFREKCRKKVRSKAQEFIAGLASQIVRGEFFHVFLTLYQPRPLSAFLPSIRSYFDWFFKLLSPEVSKKMFQELFEKFVEYWKVSILKADCNKNPEEREEELKSDTRLLSILFEGKQNDGSVLGVPRELQKGHLQQHFDSISLSLNSSKSLIQLFCSDSGSVDRKAISFIIICRGERDSIKELLKHRQLLIN